MEVIITTLISTGGSLIQSGHGYLAALLLGLISPIMIFIYINKNIKGIHITNGAGKKAITLLESFDKRFDRLEDKVDKQGEDIAVLKDKIK